MCQHMACALLTGQAKRTGTGTVSRSFERLRSYRIPALRCPNRIQAVMCSIARHHSGDGLHLTILPKVVRLKMPVMRASIQNHTGAVL